MAAIRIVDDHIELANIGSNTHAQIDTHIAAANNYVKRDGSLALTADWDIGVGRVIHTEHLRPRTAAGTIRILDNAGAYGLMVGQNGQINCTSATFIAMQMQTYYTGGNASAIVGYAFEPNNAGDNRAIVANAQNIGTGKAYCFWGANGDAYLNGNLGVGVYPPLDALHIQNGNKAIRISDDANNWARLYWDSASDSFKIYTMAGGVQYSRTFVMHDGKIGLYENNPTALLDINSDIIRLRTAKTPASAGAAGNQGDICWDANYIYVCTATNSWERAAIAAW